MSKEIALKRDEKGRLVKGTPPGPGRTPGSISPITRVKQIFEDNPAEFEEFIRGYVNDPTNRKHIVEMIDGSPKGSGGTTNLALQVNTYTGSKDQNQTIYEELEHMGFCEECLIKARKDLRL